GLLLDALLNLYLEWPPVSIYTSNPIHLHRGNNRTCGENTEYNNIIKNDNNSVSISNSSDIGTENNETNDNVDSNATNKDENEQSGPSTSNTSFITRQSIGFQSGIDQTKKANVNLQNSAIEGCGIDKNDSGNIVS